jgi:hypothetical protein
MQWKGKNHTLKDFVGCLLYTWTLKLSIPFNVVNSSCKKLWRVLCNWFLCLLQQWHFATKLVTILRWTHGKITNVRGTKLPKTFKVQQSFSATIFNLSKHKHMGLKMKWVLTTSLGEGKGFRQPTKLTGWDWAIYFDGWSQINIVTKP